MPEQRVELPYRGRDKSGEMMIVREAVPRDAGGYLSHMRTIVAETPYMLQSPSDTMPDTIEQRAMLDHIGRMPNCLCLVATGERRLPGRIPVQGTLTLLGGRTARTRHAGHLGMGVIEEAWGRGFGGALLDAALTWARANPILTRISLQVFVTNEPAIRLYQSRGFNDEGLLRREVRLVANGGETFEDLLGMGIDVTGDTVP